MTALPPVPHLPGRTPRPDPAFFDPLLQGLAGQPPAMLADSAAYRAGFAAFAARYYWESHELWEPVWAALPPASAERHLLRGLIQLANAGLKRRMGRDHAAARILVLADSALAEAFAGGRQALMGLSREDVARFRQQAATDSAQ